MRSYTSADGQMRELTCRRCMPCECCGYSDGQDAARSTDFRMCEPCLSFCTPEECFMVGVASRCRALDEELKSMLQ